ncbi:MAG: histidine kinase N-terminal 7TM domain-containing protein [Anaerolineae bacterium]
METLIASFLNLANETLAAAIVVVAASILLYNLTRNLRDPVARTSAIVLGCVTAGYLCDVFISLGPGVGTYIATLRLQWVGIAFLPAAMFHLSDALLATTGLHSRGRRRRVSRILYLISAVFLITAAFTNVLISPERVDPPYFESGIYVSLRAGPVFPVYVAYFVIASAVAFINVQRARARCLTRSTRRRMGYLQIAMLTPAVGIFPFSVLLGLGQEFSLIGLFLVNLTNVVVIFMLLFLAYPLSFFGSRIPDRVVKTELLRFILRGPATGLLALVTIIFVTPTTRIFGLQGQTFMPFAVVAVVLLWQWSIALALPYLERRLVYSGEEADQLEKLGNLSERLLTRGDLLQLLEAILSSTCDYLRVNSAFVASLNEEAPEVVGSVGSVRPTAALLLDERDIVAQLLENGVDDLHIERWQTYWIIPLYGRHSQFSGNGGAAPIGFMGIQARSVEIDLSDDELSMLATFTRRAAQALDDINLQGEIFAALEGLLPQINITRTSAADLEYRPRRESQLAAENIDPEQFRSRCAPRSSICGAVPA